MSRRNSVKIKDIVLDERIWGREQLSHSHIDNLVADLEAREKLPAILIQKIAVNNEEKLLLLDGRHRIEAFKKRGLREIEAEYYKDEVMDIEDNIPELLGVSVRRNNKYGLKTSQSDKKAKARYLAENYPQMKNKEIAALLGTTEGFISQVVSDIRARQRTSRSCLIFKINFLGWTQEKIAKIVQIDQSGVSKIMQNLSSKEMHNEYKGGKAAEEMAQYYSLDLPTIWHILSESKPDEKKLKEFYPGEKAEKAAVPCYYSDWHYYIPDSRLGIEHPGRIPGQAILGLLYFYTEEGNQIIDPMAGGGVSNDACLVMRRRCYSYDIEPDRKDILQNDIRNGYPEEAKDCDMIILDPPYADMVFKNFFKDLNDFYAFMKTVAEESYKTVKKGGKVALFMANKTGDDRACLIGECYKIFTDAGFKLIDTIGLSHSPAICDGQDVVWAKKNKRLLGVFRVIYVFKK